MKITKGRNGNWSELLDVNINKHSIFVNGGNVVISTGSRGRRLSYRISIPPILLRRLRDCCNQALTQIDGFDRHTTVTLADRQFKEGSV